MPSLSAGGPEQRHDDEGQLEEVEEEREEEHQDVDEDQEAGLAARQRRQQVLDPDVPVHAVEGEREDPRADQDEEHEGRELRGRFGGLAHEIPVEAVRVVVEPALDRRQGSASRARPWRRLRSASRGR